MAITRSVGRLNGRWQRSSGMTVSGYESGRHDGGKHEVDWHMVRAGVVATVVAALTLGISTSALAVGDPPVSLSRSKAQRIFSKYRVIASGDSLATCPGNQRATSGTITGGDSPVCAEEALMSKLLSPYRMGSLELNNRMVMAPRPGVVLSKVVFPIRQPQRITPSAPLPG